MGKALKAHRVVAYLFEAREMDYRVTRHLCPNKDCVNPEHNKPGTHAENVRDYIEKRTHCKNGHELSQTGKIVAGRLRCTKCLAQYQENYKNVNAPTKRELGR